MAGEYIGFQTCFMQIFAWAQPLVYAAIVQVFNNHRWALASTIAWNLCGMAIILRTDWSVGGADAKKLDGLQMSDVGVSATSTKGPDA